MKFQEWKYEGDIDSTNAKVPDKSGIYVLHAVESHIQCPYATDTRGILYIGKSTDLKNRLKISSNKDFKKDYEKKSDLTFDHSCLTFTTDFIDNRLVLHRQCITDGYCNDGYLHEQTQIALHYLQNEDQSLETKLLHAHVMKFGQLPPFNFTGVSLKSIWNTKEWSNWDQKVQKYDNIMMNLPK